MPLLIYLLQNSFINLEIHSLTQFRSMMISQETCWRKLLHSTRNWQESKKKIICLRMRAGSVQRSLQLTSRKKSRENWLQITLKHQRSLSDTISSRKTIRRTNKWVNTFSISPWMVKLSPRNLIMQETRMTSSRTEKLRYFSRILNFKF